MQNLRFAIRQLRKSPGFFVTTTVTLALGIGATTAIFSLVNAVLLRPLPFPDPDRLLWAQQLDQSAGNAIEPLSYPDFFDWRSRSRSFSAMAAHRGIVMTLTGTGSPQQLDGQTVSSEFFRVLGVRPMLGRDFRAEEEKPGARVVMLSHRLWQSTFGSARDIAGSAITLDGHSYTVAGVMPAGFGFPIQNPAPALWVTLANDAVGDRPFTVQRGADMLDVVARLKPGVSLTQARTELSGIAHNIATQYPDTNKAYTSAFVQTQIEHLVGDTRPALRLLFAAVGLVLLIACANVAGLLLARASSRRPELAIRSALGARRSEIVRQLLVESILLALCGGALGVLVSTWSLDALLRFVPDNLPRLDTISVDVRVLAFAIVVSVTSGLMFGMLPAWRVSRLDPIIALREGGRSVTAGRGQHRLQSWLVIAETALGLVLLVGSGLLIRSFVRVLSVDPGFDPRHVLTASLSAPDPPYSQQKRVQFYKRLLPRLAALPGVESVAAGVPIPLGAGSIGVSFQIEGHPTASGDEPSEQLSVVTPDFFRTMRIPILSGREFTWRDDAKGQAVIIVNQSFARKYFPGQNPVGKHMKSDLTDDTFSAPMREIVGVAANVKRKRLTAEAEPMYYLPWMQAVITSPALCIRTSGDPVNLIGALRGELAGMDRNIPLFRIRTLEDLVYRAGSQPRFQTLLLSCFAFIALLLSAVGLYAVLSYTVVQRTPEIGVRLALGAQREDVLGMVLRRGLMLASMGAAIGLGASLVLTRFLSGMLYEIAPFDPLTFGAVTAILLLVSLVASSAPAYRAARLDPMQTLRDQ